MSVRPVRLQLSRRKGFNLQRHSRDTNGLGAINCARPSRFGNPAIIGEYFKIGDPGGYRGPFAMSWCRTPYADAAGPAFTFVADNDVAVDLFEKLAKTNGYIQKAKALTGFNLACYCALDKRCHCDVWLRIANPTITICDLA